LHNLTVFHFNLTFQQGIAMQTHHVLIIMFVVFGLFMLANWFNRPKGPRK
jgi:hypothetical protein